MKVKYTGKADSITIIKNNRSVYGIATYLNKSCKKITQVIHIARQAMYIIDLNQLNGLHILNNAINPTATIAIEDIVTSSSVEIPVNI